MNKQALLMIANRTGATLLADNDQWKNRMEIRSASSAKLYIVAQRKTDDSWACSCFGWIRHRNCKHLKSMVPLLEAAAREAVAAFGTR